VRQWQSDTILLITVKYNDTYIRQIWDEARSKLN